MHHFTRAGSSAGTSPTGRIKAKTKHGNYNAWLDAHGDDYDFLLGVDPDHVPLPNFAERFLGYFRDPDVAFVVGPQVYGNYQRLRRRAPPSRSSSCSTRCCSGPATARARRCSSAPTTRCGCRALRQIGGLPGLDHRGHGDEPGRSTAPATRAPAARWTSVYTPDVVAVGEGPASFTDYFSQQDRWSRGTDEVLAAALLAARRTGSARARSFTTCC